MQTTRKSVTVLVFPEDRAGPELSSIVEYKSMEGLPLAQARTHVDLSAIVRSPPPRVASLNCGKAGEFAFFATLNKDTPLNYTFKEINPKTTWRGAIVVAKHIANQEGTFGQALALSPEDVGIIMKCVAVIQDRNP